MSDDGHPMLWIIAFLIAGAVALKLGSEWGHERPALSHEEQQNDDNQRLFWLLYSPK